ncbi:NAD-dependent epimerase/dehydratase family protein [Ramlibacter alkalitolerans]|uniref:NAD-dependent epimerase/dehydratase family protein n=1 Tax=Ramlibacter alkalitolerans TaxID=2039631 RepID=A0ABS1JQE7_9BURK|nr:NAD-dependent epimerase/dehydratase family protein [Ramlibacter alkalitolerans]MBL0426076.1 NAD-dependent epimerase/dehydratase family protein [Ramlibacter alkalitolerans]
MALQRHDAVVVTGASGFIGRALVRHLHAAGRPVVAVSRHAWTPPAGVRAVAVAGYDDVATLAAAVPAGSVVVHLASIAHRGGEAAEFTASTRAAQDMLAAAAAAGARRFVFVSSIGVNGNVTHGKPFTEADPPEPAEPYARSKLRAEEIVRAGPLEHVILRPPLVAGPDAPGNFGRLLRAVRSGLPLPFASIRNARTFIAIDNLVDLLALCLDHPAAANQLLLAGDAEDLSTPELVRCIAEGLGRPARLFPLPSGLLRALAAGAGKARLAESLCGSLQVDAGKAKRLLGWQPRLTAAEGVRRAAAESQPGP